MGAALRVGHVQQDAGSQSFPGVPTSNKVRTGHPFKLLTGERDRRTAAFVEVCARYGAVSRIARAWRVNDSVVRRVRDGLAPLTDDRIRALPRAQREQLFKVLDASAQLSLF